MATLTAPEQTTEQRQLVEGYAAVFDEVTTLFNIEDWEYREVLQRGAFDGADLSNVVLNFDHGRTGRIYARTTNNTLTLNVDERGLHMSADIIDTSDGQDVYKLVKRGDVNKMSYSFTIAKDNVSYDERQKVCTRTIEKIDKVYDVSIVVNPAYDGTSVAARDKEDVKELTKNLRERAILETYL